MEKLSNDTGYFKKPVEINRGLGLQNFTKAYAIFGNGEIISPKNRTTQITAVTKHLPYAINSFFKSAKKNFFLLLFQLKKPTMFCHGAENVSGQFFLLRWPSPPLLEI